MVELSFKLLIISAFHRVYIIMFAFHRILGSALMAVWSSALSLTGSCLSPLPRFESQVVHVRKISDWRLNSGFCLILQAGDDLHTICKKCNKI